MTYTAHDPQLLINAVIARLASELTEEVGDGEAPDDDTKPYVVVHSLIGEPGEGSLSDPHQVANPAFQVNSVGETRAQAQWMQKQVRDALLGWTPTVPGFGTFPIHLLSDGPVQPEPGVQPTIFNTSDRFTVRISS